MAIKPVARGTEPLIRCHLGAKSAKQMKRLEATRHVAPPFD